MRAGRLGRHRQFAVQNVTKVRGGFRRGVVQQILHDIGPKILRKRDPTAAGRYAAIACEPALVHFQGSSSSILVFG
jgi:hypothetical protein